jgi:hypothetical protein
VKTRVTKLFKLKNNGLIDSSKPGAADAIREADRAGLLVADLGVYTAQEGFFPFGYLGISCDASAQVAQGAVNFDFATVTVGSQLQITPTSTRAALRGVDSIIGNSNRLDQDTVFSARAIGFGVGTPDGDLLANPAAIDEAIAGLEGQRYSRPALADAIEEYGGGQDEKERAAFAAAVSDWRKGGEDASQ